MSDLQVDPTWREAARNVARELDRNHMGNAQDMMRQDLYQLQNDPKAQHDFINMVNRYERKGVGADFHISTGPQGQEMWQIVPPNYGRDNRYPVPVPQPAPPPEVVIVEPQRPSTGERIIEGIATGVGVGVGIGVMDKIFNGRDHHHHRRR
ncbi:MAG: hypothetical protein K2X29_15100 [Candidatus Obscuribacterales bacterium]|nr:hypothetical protein [Candidatus Obscuribacterales bacterium]